MNSCLRTVTRRYHRCQLFDRRAPLSRCVNDLPRCAQTFRSLIRCYSQLAITPTGQCINQSIDINTGDLCFKLPVQVIPSPLYPGGQAQLKLPGVLTQIAIGSQPPLLTAHSFTSTASQLKLYQVMNEIDSSGISGRQAIRLT